MELGSGLELGGAHSFTSAIHPVTAPFAFTDVVIDDSPSSQPTARVIVAPESNLRTPSSFRESNQPPISKWRSFAAWSERITGNVLSIIGIPVSAAGVTLATIYSDLSNPLGQVGVALTAFGVVMDRCGNILLENSRNEAAAIKDEINRRAKKIAKAAELTPEQVDDLSTEFFGMSQTYQTYIGCASKADRILGRILSVGGPTAAATGAVLTLSGETTLGPILAVGGAAAITAGNTLQKRGEAYSEQLKHLKMVELAQEKARLRLRTSSGSGSAMLQTRNSAAI